MAETWEHASERDRWLEQLTGVRSSKPTFYAEWRRRSLDLQRALDGLHRISAALCITTRGPEALSKAVVEAAAHHFPGAWVVMAFSGGEEALPLQIMATAPDGEDVTVADRLAPEPQALLARVLEERALVAVDGPSGPGSSHPSGRQVGGVGAPMARRLPPIGALCVLLPPGGALDDTDVSIVKTLANQAAVALDNAYLYQASEELRARATHHARELEKQNRQLQRVRRRLVEARQQELLGEERNRIARELHDSVVQHLVSIGMNLEWCRQQEGLSPRTFERISVSKELARAAVSRIREAIFELSSLDGGRQGLAEALRELATDFQGVSELEVGVQVRGLPRQLPLQAEHALFQIAQEATFNVLHHASARRAGIVLDYRPSSVQLSVVDDGSGSAATVRRRLEESRAAPPSGEHRGLLNIATRAAQLGGHLSIEPRRPQGVRVRVTVPAVPAAP